MFWNMPLPTPATNQAERSWSNASACWNMAYMESTFSVFQPLMS